MRFSLGGLKEKKKRESTFAKILNCVKIGSERRHHLKMYRQSHIEYLHQYNIIIMSHNVNSAYSLLHGPN